MLPFYNLLLFYNLIFQPDMKYQARIFKNNMQYFLGSCMFCKYACVKFCSIKRTLDSVRDGLVTGIEISFNITDRMTKYFINYLFVSCLVPWQTRCLATGFHCKAAFTILVVSSFPKPNLWLKSFPAPFVFHPSSSGLVFWDVSTIMCCTSLQVKLGLK